MLKFGACSMEESLMRLCKYPVVVDFTWEFPWEDLLFLWKFLWKQASPITILQRPRVHCSVASSTCYSKAAISANRFPLKGMQTPKKNGWSGAWGGIMQKSWEHPTSGGKEATEAIRPDRSHLQIVQRQDVITHPQRWLLRTEAQLCSNDYTEKDTIHEPYRPKTSLVHLWWHDADDSRSETGKQRRRSLPFPREAWWHGWCAEVSFYRHAGYEDGKGMAKQNSTRQTVKSQI